MMRYLKIFFCSLFVALFLASPAVASSAKEAQKCGIENMQEMYLKDGDVDKYCWYCKIVIILTNSYLNAASKSLSTSQELAKLILKLGFMIWLAYYILQQVSSFAPIQTGKMLQQILIMGFKVALAMLVIKQGETVIRELILNPIMGLGVDYGLELLNPMLPMATAT